MNNDIESRLERIEAKLDAVIKAMHDYDDDNIYSGYDEPNEALLKAASLYNEELNKKYGESSFESFMDTKQSPCVKHDASSWNEEEMEQRMNIIGQNGNEGLHYDKDEFDDYGKRVGKKDNPKQMNGVESNVPFVKTRNKRDKWVSPYPPNPTRKSAVVEHQKYPPHKH